MRVTSWRLAALVGLICAAAGCSAALNYPITDGHTAALPEAGARAIVWGGHAAAHSTAVTWLQRRNLRVVDRSLIQEALPSPSATDAEVIRAARTLGVDYVIFIDTPVQEGEAATGTAYGAYASVGRSTTYSTSVSIRGVQVASGDVVVTGTARYVSTSDQLDDSLVKLTCQALATGWGLRPAGNHPIASQSMCEK
jgi:hypothetical protein